MNSDDRAWVEMLRETKTSGNISFGGRQMRRLLGIVDGLEADTLVRRKEQLCRQCYLAAAMQEKNHDRQ